MKQIKPEYLKDYAPGYTLFTKKDGNFLSEGISWFENLGEAASFNASHVLLVVDSQRGLECAEKGVEFCNLQDYFNDPGMQVICREPVELDNATVLQCLHRGYCLEAIETPYDYSAYLGFVISIITRLQNLIKPLRKLPVPFHWPGAMVCSGFVSNCYKATDKYKNIPLFLEWHISRITPNMLWNRFPYKPFRFDKER